MSSSELSAKYDPSIIEDKWYSYWMDMGLFSSKPDEREPYTIVIPPPNVTGVLHMGHMLNNTIQDVLVRRARMQGKNACWVPGTDHASIATEAKVVAKLKEEGIDKLSISRDEFLSHAWEWREKHGGIILEQLKKLGASCDWSRTKFTMDKDMSESVINVFIDLFNKGLIYRGVRMVNWDPSALTALSDEEVVFKEVNSKLYYIKYPSADGSSDCIIIATTRPETILGDTAICVHPDDERFRHLHGRKVLVPLINREIPVIADEYVDREFGTGALKITPAHDVNDYMLGNKYNLESIDIFNDNGTLNEKAQLYIGEDRFVVREKISVELREKSYMVKEDAYINKVGYSERTNEVIEPKLSMQWFLCMPELAKPALDVVLDDTVMFYPAKFKNTYKYWMENVRDWCISRQLWWGQRIPAYYLPDNKIVVAETPEKALAIAKEKYNQPNLKLEDLRQDEDVVDTWFSSWLWPITVFDGIRNPENEDMKYYYPTNDLVTAPEILFFWVARMIMAGLEYPKQIPFKNVYLTGIVRDKLGRKMSKSLGNSPDPIDLIKQYGADGVRMGMLLTSPAGNDLPFDESLCEQGRNFSNKIWNAYRLIKGWQVNEEIHQPEYAKVAIDWFSSRLSQAIVLINDNFDKYRISEALMITYKLVWDDLCSWYLEMIKPAYQQPIDVKTYQATILFYENILKLLHPFMPFITEELWQNIREREKGLSVMIEKHPIAGEINTHIALAFENNIDVVMAIRNIRKDKNIPNKDSLVLYAKKTDQKIDTFFDCILQKLCNISEIIYSEQKPERSLAFIVRSTEYYIPISETADLASEIKKLQEELEYTQGFLTSVERKLSNERFVSSAPKQVVEIEIKKKDDAILRINVIMEQLKELNG